jgi:hypothetical protein
MVVWESSLFGNTAHPHVTTWEVDGANAHKYVIYESVFLSFY